MKVLAEIPPRASPALAPGTLRRRDLDAFAGLLDRLDGTGSVLLSAAGAGRGTVALGLATAAAATGTTTVLVECDLAAPALADTLGLAPRPGLAEQLRGEAEPGATLRPVVLAGPGSGGAREPLACVVAGRPAAADEGLLGSVRFRQALTAMREAYELVVLDGPPLADEEALLAVAGEVERTLAVGSKREVPRRLRPLIDGLVLPPPG